MTTTTKRYTVARGAYYGTTEDRADRWYVEDSQSRQVERWGAGYRTRREALQETERLEKEYGL